MLIRGVLPELLPVLGAQHNAGGTTIIHSTTPRQPTSQFTNE
jgi:hypothetical protein